MTNLEKLASSPILQSHACNFGKLTDFFKGSVFLFKTNHKNMKDKIVVIGIVILIAMVGILLARDSGKFGGIQTGEEYVATSTRNFNGVAMSNLQVIREGYGSVGELTITGATAGTINLFNATTSNVNLRTGNKATSTILIATFPNSTAANTYQINSRFTDGLMVELLGTVPTSTLTVK